MSFFKKLFTKEKPMEEPFTPSPTQHVPGLEPIIVQAVENLFPRADEQKEIFDVLVENRKNTTVLIILSLLSMVPKNLEGCKSMLAGNISTPHSGTLTKDGTFYHLAMDSGFHSLKDAEKWVKSITNSQV